MWEKMSAAKLLLCCEDDELMDPSRCVGASVVMRAFRGRVFVDDPDDPDFESVRFRGWGFGLSGRGSEFLNVGGVGFGIRREVRPPPGK